MKITRILPKFLARTYQEEDLRRAEGRLEYHRVMARVFEERVAEGREELQRLEGRNSWMFQLVFLIVIVVIGYIAYTGIDVTSEYDDISKIRNQIFEDVIDPLAKKVLKHSSEYNLDEIIDSTISKYGDV